MVASAVEQALAESGAPWRRVGRDEWGLTAEAAGRPLHIGVAVRDGLLCAQAEVLDAGVADEHALLHRNRMLRLVRFAHTRAGAVWVQGELPPAAATAEEVDRLLGMLLDAAAELRWSAAAA